MIAFTDVHYTDNPSGSLRFAPEASARPPLPSALAACVVANDWGDEKPLHSVTARVSPIAEYEPGAFYKRELPCLLAVLERAPFFFPGTLRLGTASRRRETARECTHVVIDGYVWLDNAQSPGLGAHLFDALGRKTPVIGIAKTAFRGSEMALRLERPGTEKPLFVTSIGITPELALQHLQRLHGPYRIPTMLKLVDQLSRGSDHPR